MSRAKIEGKVQQAALRKKLLDLATESTSKGQVEDHDHHHRQERYHRYRDRKSRHHSERFFREVDTLRRATGVQLKHIEQQSRTCDKVHLQANTAVLINESSVERSTSPNHAQDQSPEKQVGALRKLKAHTDAEFKEIMQAVKALKSKIDRGQDIAAIAEESAKRDGGVPAQVRGERMRERS
eukprot:757938-Hanusia_phi.AAC.3